MERAQFIGTWRLVSWLARDASGAQSHPYGDKPHGYIIYSEAGYMSALIQGNAGTGIPGVGLYLGYGGPFEVLEDRVVHIVELSSFQPFVGSRQERMAQFDGDQLTLSATADGVSHFITWKRC